MAWFRNFTALAVLFLLAAAFPVPAGDGIRQVQLKLQKKGFDPGPADGLMGPKTRQAIREFQASQGLAITGRLDEPTRKALGVEFQMVTVPADTRIHVRLNDYLDSGQSRVGQRFTMTVAEAVAVGNTVVIPRGATVTGTVVEVESAQRPQKGGKLVLRPDALSLDGETVLLQGTITGEGQSLEGEGSIKEDLKEIGIAAGIGAALGGILKGGKGALAGVLIGGGGAFLGTKGEQVKLRPETRLVIELSQSVSVPVS